jgi:hypothetical protein
MDRETALRKVLRCLRLAASSNPHEAAAALRQARALMDQYGLTEADAYASEIHEADAPTRCRGAVPTQSLMFLISVVEDGFRCGVVIRREKGWRGEGRTTVHFYGAGSDAEVAAYAFTVLRRQLEADKAKHTQRIRKRSNKETRGEEFAIGWISAVSRLFPKAELSDERKAAIDSKKQSLHGSLQACAGREVAKPGAPSWRDREAGYDAGSRARVNPGVGESAQQKLEHVP